MDKAIFIIRVMLIVTLIIGALNCIVELYRFQRKGRKMNKAQKTRSIIDRLLITVGITICCGALAIFTLSEKTEISSWLIIFLFCINKILDQIRELWNLEE